MSAPPICWSLTILSANPSNESKPKKVPESDRNGRDPLAPRWQSRAEGTTRRHTELHRDMTGDRAAPGKASSRNRNRSRKPRHIPIVLGTISQQAPQKGDNRDCPFPRGK